MTLNKKETRQKKLSTFEIKFFSLFFSVKEPSLTTIAATTKKLFLLENYNFLIFDWYNEIKLMTIIDFVIENNFFLLMFGCLFAFVYFFIIIAPFIEKKLCFSDRKIILEKKKEEF